MNLNNFNLNFRIRIGRYFLYIQTLLEFRMILYLDLTKKIVSKVYFSAISRRVMFIYASVSTYIKSFDARCHSFMACHSPDGLLFYVNRSINVRNVTWTEYISIHLKFATTRVTYFWLSININIFEDCKCLQSKWFKIRKNYYFLLLALLFYIMFLNAPRCIWKWQLNTL